MSTSATFKTVVSLKASAVDAELGPVFYSIKQTPDRFEIKRDRGECMSCHSTSRTKNVPGYLVRSVFPDSDGTPFYGLGTTTTDHTTDFESRFGGWFVTGKHGALRHRGNSIANEKAKPPIDLEQGANVQSLATYFNTDKYLTDTSDIVALMVLEHQTQMHNLITLANYEWRRASYHDREMNRLLEREPNYVSDSTKRRYRSAADKLIQYMLMKDEQRFPSLVKGNSSFQQDFESAAGGSSSLRRLDLKTRLFEFPCSFLVESDSFQKLPGPVLTYIHRRLANILTGQDKSDDFDYLTSDDRRSLKRVLTKSIPGLKKLL